MVGRLDGRDGGQVNLLVGTVQAPVADPESGGGRYPQPCQVVADVGRAGDLRFRA
jgi:hypothetical protein